MSDLNQKRYEHALCEWSDGSVDKKNIPEEQEIVEGKLPAEKKAEPASKIIIFSF